MSDLTRLSISQIKYYKSLQQKKYRNQYKSFLIEGEKMVREIAFDANSNLKLKHILAENDFLKENPKLMNRHDCISVSGRDLEKISSLSTSSRVIMELEIPEYDENIDELSEEVNIYFESIRDPGNLGTIIRTADWFGINKVICSPDSVDAFNPKVIQSSMGSIARVKVLYVEAAEILKIASKDKQFENIATLLEGVNLDSFTFPEKGIIYFGNESKGLSSIIQKDCQKAITIPRSQKQKGPESLNLSISAGIILREMYRQEFIRNES